MPGSRSVRTAPISSWRGSVEIRHLQLDVTAFREIYQCQIRLGRAPVNAARNALPACHNIHCVIIGSKPIEAMQSRQYIARSQQESCAELVVVLCDLDPIIPGHVFLVSAAFDRNGNLEGGFC